MNTTVAPRIAALALSSVFTALMLFGTDHLATTEAPQGLVAQVAAPAASVPAKI